MEESDKLSNFNILLQFPGTQERPETVQKHTSAAAGTDSISRNCRITFDSIMTTKMNKN